MAQLNASPVRDLFAANVGRHLSAAEVPGTFDRAYGRGAGQRVTLRCQDGLILELRIGLSGRIQEDASLAELIGKAAPRPVGCPGGRVDAAGWAN